MKKIYSFTNSGLTDNGKPQSYHVVASSMVEAIGVMQTRLPDVLFTVIAEGPECMISE